MVEDTRLLPLRDLDAEIARLECELRVLDGALAGRPRRASARTGGERAEFIREMDRLEQMRGDCSFFDERLVALGERIASYKRYR